MAAERERKLTLSDPGRDAAGDELEMLLRDGDDQPCDDVAFDGFLERLPPEARAGRKPERR